MKMNFIHLSRAWYKVVCNFYGMKYPISHGQCFHLLVWSEHGMKCLYITKYIDIVFCGLFIKKYFRIQGPILPARVLKNELRHKKSHQT